MQQNGSYTLILFQMSSIISENEIFIVCFLCLFWVEEKGKGKLLHKKCDLQLYGPSCSLSGGFRIENTKFIVTAISDVII